MDRSSGILLHVTSLPGPHGIGDLGPAAYAWVDRLAAAKQTWWQMLPLVLLLAAAVGAVTGITLIVAKRLGRGVPIPFGPYLAGASWIAMMWGAPIMDAWLAAARLR